MSEKCHNVECQDESKYTVFMKLSFHGKVYNVEVKTCAKHALELNNNANALGHRELEE